MSNRKLHPAPAIVLPEELGHVEHTVQAVTSGLRVHGLGPTKDKRSAPYVEVNVGAADRCSAAFVYVSNLNTIMYSADDVQKRIDELRAALVVMQAETEAMQQWEESHE